MMKSMTGFASASHDDERGCGRRDVRAVNHRFLDLQLRLPQAIADLEPRVRGARAAAHRPRPDRGAACRCRRAAGPTPVVELNDGFVRALTAAHRRRARRRPGRGRAHARRPAAPAAGADDPRAAGRRRTRRRRGPAPPTPSLGRASTRSTRCARARAPTCAPISPAASAALAALVDAIARAADHGRAQARRPAAGAGARAERVAADRSGGAGAGGGAGGAALGHLRRGDPVPRPTSTHWDALTDADEPCGRKLDFLLQEMNREVNTIGCKADGLHGVRAHHPGQGRARADAGAGPECRVGRGLLFVISAPSGTGKTTLVERLVQILPNLRDVAVVHLAAGPRRRARRGRL